MQFNMMSSENFSFIYIPSKWENTRLDMQVLTKIKNPTIISSDLKKDVVRITDYSLKFFTKIKSFCKEGAFQKSTIGMSKTQVDLHTENPQATLAQNYTCYFWRTPCVQCRGNKVCWDVAVQIILPAANLTFGCSVQRTSMKTYCKHVEPSSYWKL